MTLLNYTHGVKKTKRRQLKNRKPRLKEDSIGKWQYRKVGPRNVREICVRCNVNPQKRVSGKDTYRAICSTCEDILYYKNYPNRNAMYRIHKKDHCEFCGFIPVDQCQLDVDHIDGNKNNNDTNNLQTLCANCHRLKTKLNKDGTYKRQKKRLPEESTSESLE